MTLAPQYDNPLNKITEEAFKNYIIENNDLCLVRVNKNMQNLPNIQTSIKIAKNKA